MANIFKCNSYKQMVSSMQENGSHISPPNLELAAIVTRYCIPESQKDVEIGGWGLKFLKKDGNCESCKENTSISVDVPADVHGGPRIGKGGGPSGLIERWKSGGSCDCGGWDLGCPLTVLHTRLNHKDGFGVRLSFDLFEQGCKQSVPVLKMVDVLDGSYDLSYKSVLSPLQSVAIAVAAIHSGSLVLQSLDPYFMQIIMKQDNLPGPSVQHLI